MFISQQSSCRTLIKRVSKLVIDVCLPFCLRLGKGLEAAAEFQKIVDHEGNYWSLYYPVSYVGMARLAAMAGDMQKAGKAYQSFFALWKDADPEIPILRQARAEYATL